MEHWEKQYDSSSIDTLLNTVPPSALLIFTVPPTPTQISPTIHVRVCGPPESLPMQVGHPNLVDDDLRS